MKHVESQTRFTSPDTPNHANCSHLIDDSAPNLLCLLLLAELMVHSSCRPASGPALCSTFKSIFHQMDVLMRLSRKLHGVSDEETMIFASMENRLESLPLLEHSAKYLSSLQVNESFLQLYVHVQSFRQHVDWLTLAKQNVSMPSHSAESSSTHLRRISTLLNTSLHQMNQEVPQSLSLSFPVVSTSFDVLQVSVEISAHLETFCRWTKQVLRYLQWIYHCPKH